MEALTDTINNNSFCHAHAGRERVHVARGGEVVLHDGQARAPIAFTSSQEGAPASTRLGYGVQTTARLARGCIRLRPAHLPPVHGQRSGASATPMPGRSAYGGADGYY